MYTVLVCDDEKDIVNALRINLSAEGYEVICAYNGREVLASLDEKHVDLILIDIMMPELDGLETVSHIRKKSNIPVIFLTAKSEESDLILGLNIGADDYITKPFRSAEVTARVRSHLRRYKSLGGDGESETTLCVGGITIDDRGKTVKLDGDDVTLTPSEYKILLFLTQNKGKVYSSEELYRNVWDGSPYGSENTVAVHIRHLREKLEYDASKPRYIKVVWGHGYKIDDDI